MLLVVTVPFNKVAGKCYLVYHHELEPATDWCKQGPYRFYFTESYDPKTFKFDYVPEDAKKIGYKGKGQFNISNNNKYNKTNIRQGER